MGLMDKMMGVMMGRMSKEEKEAMMNNAMDKMMGGMSAAEKQDMMAEMMPKMMEGVNMLDMMPRMMLTMMPRMLDEVKGILAEQGKELDLKEFLPKIMAPMMSTMLKGMDPEKMVQKKEEMMGRMFALADLDHKIPETQMKMQPGCIRRLMGHITPDERLAYTGHVLEIMIDEGTKGLDEERKQAFRQRILAAVDDGFAD